MPIRQRNLPCRARAARLLALLALGSLAGCRSFGARQVPIDRFDYNEAIARSADEQMLLNVVRLRYGEIPVFLAVNSVLTQYTYSGRLGASGGGSDGVAAPEWSVGASASVIYAERPTITYAPLTGEEFAAQLVSPLPAELIFGLVESGWPPEQVLKMTVQRINDVRNASFLPVASAEGSDASATFGEIVRLMFRTSARAGMEVATGEDDERYIYFSEHADAETQALIDRLKQDLGLAPDLSAFKLTTRTIRRGPDEVTLKVRSLLDLMGFLSRGVEIPPAHLEENRVAVPSADEYRSPWHNGLRVETSEEAPPDPFVAVQHDGHWFYIPHTDHQSKMAFSLLLYFFQMQSPQPTAAPLITVPAG